MADGDAARRALEGETGSLATGLRAGGVIRRENTEQMELELLDLADLRGRALRGEIEDGPSALAILLASARLDP
jgi:hypothetical protein